MAATIKGKTGEWEMVIGLEVHAQVISKSKLFSGASTQFGASPFNRSRLALAERSLGRDDSLCGGGAEV
jgi:Glu-tRNA(Gln) amidotransferase subunit E-like FAD-binding protein